MRPIWIFSSILCVLCAGCTEPEYSFYPSLKKHDIPPHISGDLRNQIEQLYASDAGTRAVAAFKLGKMGERATSAIPFLIGSIPDSSSVIMWTPTAVKTTPGEQATIALSQIGKPAIPALISALQYFYIRRPAAWALSKIQDPPTTQHLINLLRVEDWHMRLGAALALGEIKDATAVEPLIAVLTSKEENARARGAAAEALGKIKDTRAVEPLIAALKDKDAHWAVGAPAVTALGEIKDPRAVEPLIAALRGRWYVLAPAARALGEIKDKRAVEPLIATLKRCQYVDARAAAAEALGKIRDPRAIETLINCVNPLWSPETALPAVEALRTITGKDFGYKRKDWKNWWKQNRESILTPR